VLWCRTITLALEAVAVLTLLGLNLKCSTRSGPAGVSLSFGEAKKAT
jgi:hypothetical protein